MSLVRVLRTARQTHTHYVRVDGQLADVTGDLTATLRRLDGTLVNTATATHVSTGVYTYSQPEQANLDTLTLDWSGSIAGAAVTVRDIVEIVGGYLFGIAEARGKPPPLSAALYPDDMIAERRIEVEQDAEKIARTTFVPRFTRVALAGTDRSELLTPHADLRALRAVRVNGVDWTAPEVAAVYVSSSGVLTRPGGAIWPSAGGSTAQNIIVEYEHGLDYPPGRVRAMGIVHLRHLLTETDSGEPTNVISFTVRDGGVYRMATPGKDHTGLPNVDAVYKRYGQELGGFA